MKAAAGALLVFAVAAATGSVVDPHPDHPGLWIAILIGAMWLGAAVAART